MARHQYRNIADDNIAAEFQGDGLVADALIRLARQGIFAADDTRPKNRDVLKPLAPDQAVVEVGMAEVLIFIPLLLAGLNGVIGFRIGRGLDGCTLIEIERDVALEVNGTGKICPGGEINRSATGGAGGIDSFIDCG